jgi:hypothetical protein
MQKHWLNGHYRFSVLNLKDLLFGKRASILEEPVILGVNNIQDVVEGYE